MKRYLFSTITLLLILTSLTATDKKSTNPVDRPKLVVGIVIDQMRWDFLYRFYDQYSKDGFKRLITNGYSCDNTHLNYIPTYTAVGHTSIFTGSVPSLHGIAGNNWYEAGEGFVYCTDDSTVNTVGAEGDAGKMSPRKLLTTTITDELRIATNYKSKVIGVSLKDRASILPAGHNPTGAFWLDDASGKFISSEYYMSQLPEWVDKFNNTKTIEKLISKPWTPLLNKKQYQESSEDMVEWEGLLPGAGSPVFNYDVKKAYDLNHGSLRQTPMGNTLTLQFAAEAVESNKLGKDDVTDFLTVNCASTDYAGHLFGPNAMEIQDLYLRLDKDLAQFFKKLDQEVGKNNYLIFLTADHGASHAKGFSEFHKMPTGFYGHNFEYILDSCLQQVFHVTKLVSAVENNQVYFNKSLIDSLSLDFNKIKTAAVDFLMTQPGIQFAVDQDKVETTSIPDHLKTQIINGYNWKRSGSVQFIPESGWLPSYVKKGTTHGAWNPYDTHIPLLFMGWKIKPGKTDVLVEVTDIAATLAALLHIQMPNGCIGKPIQLNTVQSSN